MSFAPPQAPPPSQSSPILKIACFTCLAVVLLGILGCGGVTMMVTSAMKGNQAYKDGLVRAKADPRVKEALGEPIEESWWATGAVHETGGGSGKVLVVTALSGPKGDAVFTIEGSKAGDVWGITRAEVLVTGTPGKKIDVWTPGRGWYGEGPDATPSDEQPDSPREPVEPDAPDEQDAPRER